MFMMCVIASLSSHVLLNAILTSREPYLDDYHHARKYDCKDEPGRMSKLSKWFCEECEERQYNPPNEIPNNQHPATLPTFRTCVKYMITAFRGIDMGIAHTLTLASDAGEQVEFHDPPADCFRSKGDRIARLQAERKNRRYRSRRCPHASRYRWPMPAAQGLAC